MGCYFKIINETKKEFWSPFGSIKLYNPFRYHHLTGGCLGYLLTPSWDDNVICGRWVGDVVKVVGDECAACEEYEAAREFDDYDDPTGWTDIGPLLWAYLRTMGPVSDDEETIASNERSYLEDAADRKNRDAKRANGEAATEMFDDYIRFDRAYWAIRDSGVERDDNVLDPIKDIADDLWRGLSDADKAKVKENLYAGKPERLTEMFGNG